MFFAKTMTKQHPGETDNLPVITDDIKDFMPLLSLSGSVAGALVGKIGLEPLLLYCYSESERAAVKQRLAAMQIPKYALSVFAAVYYATGYYEFDAIAEEINYAEDESLYLAMFLLMGFTTGFTSASILQNVDLILMNISDGLCNVFDRGIALFRG